jgi:hypothetical protein
MNSIKTIFLFLILSVLISCEDEAGKKQSNIVNPNGDSELALLMRSMFDDGVNIKEDLLNGEAPTLSADFLKIHTAKPTEEGKNATPEYASYARAYEDAVKAFQNSNPYQRVEAYQHMVNSCIQCHQEICPGPVRKIRKLVLSDKELGNLTQPQ